MFLKPKRVKTETRFIKKSKSIKVMWKDIDELNQEIVENVKKNRSRVVPDNRPGIFYKRVKGD